MPIIKARPNRVRSVRHICRLQEPNRDALVLYARFTGDAVDYVLNQLIETTLLKDREFLTCAKTIRTKSSSRRRAVTRSWQRPRQPSGASEDRNDAPRGRVSGRGQPRHERRRRHARLAHLSLFRRTRRCSR